MTYFLTALIVVLVALVVYSLVRGIIAFMKSTRDELERDPGQGASDMQILQNKMMFNRIKYQALAIIVVAILLAVSR